MDRTANLILLIAGSATIVLAVLFALVQHDLKRLLGYHAVSQVGYMVLGIGTGNPIGIAGGLFHMVNNALYKSCLFLSGGNVEKRTGTTDLANLGGLAKAMPITFFCFLAASLSISGIPPFNGFVSKWMIYQGIIESARGHDPLMIVWLTSAMFGSALTIASFMKLLHAIFLGRPSKDMTGVKEVGLWQSLPVICLASLCLIFGIFAFVIPIPLFIAPSVGLTMSFMGVWKPVTATLLIAVGIVFGIIAYYIFRFKGFRTVAPFEGGETQEQFERVSGTEFYNTVKEVKPLSALYAREETGSLDIYTIGRRLVQPWTRFFKYLHNGILPTYIVWCLLGMIAMFIVLSFK